MRLPSVCPATSLALPLPSLGTSPQKQGEDSPRSFPWGKMLHLNFFRNRSGGFLSLQLKLKYKAEGWSRGAGQGEAGGRRQEASPSPDGFKDRPITGSGEHIASTKGIALPGG